MAEPRRYIPALAPIYDRLTPFALPILRIGIGLILIPHGAQKLFGWFGGMGFEKFTALFNTLGYRPGAVWVTLVALTEFVGGILLVLGLFTRAAALALVIFMIVAVHFTSGKGFFWTAGGLEYSLLILLVGLVFLIRGGGEYSLDRRLGREL
ncbi:MAG: DoxX family protein [Alphaproteobacteria bacterium]|nr:MAG: DoxX family protein [Alphaproteobacteria bacterium]